METQDIYEVWNKEGSGVLSVEPLILTACKEGRIGSVYSYDGGCIYKTVFTYLCGNPDEKYIAEHPDLIYNSRLVCMSSEWAEYIRKMPVKFVLRRELMKPLSAASEKKLKALPEGYRTVFRLYCIDGLSHRDIAHLLGIKEKSSSANLSRARALLIADIRQYQKDHAEGNDAVKWTRK